MRIKQLLLAIVLIVGQFGQSCATNFSNKEYQQFVECIGLFSLAFDYEETKTHNAIKHDLGITENFDTVYERKNCDDILADTRFNKKPIKLGFEKYFYNEDIIHDTVLYKREKLMFNRKIGMPGIIEAAIGGFLFDIIETNNTIYTHDSYNSDLYISPLVQNILERVPNKNHNDYTIQFFVDKLKNLWYYNN